MALSIFAGWCSLACWTSHYLFITNIHDSRVDTVRTTLFLPRFLCLLDIYFPPLRHAMSCTLLLRVSFYCCLFLKFEAFVIQIKNEYIINLFAIESLVTCSGWTCLLQVWFSGLYDAEFFAICRCSCKK